MKALLLVGLTWSGFAAATPVEDSQVIGDTLRDSFSEGVPVRQALAALERTLGRRPLPLNPQRFETVVLAAQRAQTWTKESPGDVPDCPAHGAQVRAAAASAIMPEARREPVALFYLALHGCLSPQKQREAVDAQAARVARYDDRLQRRVTYNFRGAKIDPFGPTATDGDVTLRPGGVSPTRDPAIIAAAAAALPAADIARRYTKSPGAVPLPATGIPDEMQAVVGVADASILDMNARGQRFVGAGAFNGLAGNVSRMKLDCHHQSEIVQQALHAAGIGDPADRGNLYQVRIRNFEGKTSEQIAASRILSIRPPNIGLPFMNGETVGENWYNNGHYWVEVRSKDPSQPIIHIDTWKGVYGVQLPGTAEIEWRQLSSATRRPDKTPPVQG